VAQDFASNSSQIRIFAGQSNPGMLIPKDLATGRDPKCLKTKILPVSPLDRIFWRERILEVVDYRDFTWNVSPILLWVRICGRTGLFTTPRSWKGNRSIPQRSVPVRALLLNQKRPAPTLSIPRERAARVALSGVWQPARRNPIPLQSWDSAPRPKTSGKPSKSWDLLNSPPSRR
jgi:hypothetical protein